MAKKKKKKKKIFWPLYKLIVCIFMVLIVVGLAFVDFGSAVGSVVAVAAVVVRAR